MRSSRSALSLSPLYSRDEDPPRSLPLRLGLAVIAALSTAAWVLCVHALMTLTRRDASLLYLTCYAQAFSLFTTFAIYFFGMFTIMADSTPTEKTGATVVVGAANVLFLLMAVGGMIWLQVQQGNAERNLSQAAKEQNEEGEEGVAGKEEVEMAEIGNG